MSIVNGLHHAGNVRDEANDCLSATEIMPPVLNSHNALNDAGMATSPPGGVECLDDPDDDDGVDIDEAVINFPNGCETAEVNHKQMSEEQVLKEALACPKYGPAVRALMDGDSSDYSCANIALDDLCLLLAWAGGNHKQVASIAGRSKLAPEDWNELKNYDSPFPCTVAEATALEACRRSLVGFMPSAPVWDEPVPLGNDSTVPAFPLDCLPDWLRRWVEEISTALQTPIDLAAMLSLAVAAAAIARKFEADVRENWQEALNLFVVVAMLVGERKSALVRALTEHVHRIEMEENEHLKLPLQQNQSERTLLEKRITHLQGQAAKCKDATDRQKLKKEIGETVDDLHTLPTIHKVQLLCDDETPESLAKLLAEQDGRMLQVSAEGTAFEIVLGRYSEKTNCDVYLKGHSGDYLSVGRIGREGEKVDHPALSIALAVQPDVLTGMGSNATLANRGFLARFLYAVPASKLGHREISPPAITEETQKEFDARMRKLWLSGTNSRVYKPKQIKFSQEAEDRLLEFLDWLEPRLAPGGELAELSGWPTKLGGACVRLAAILHCCEMVGQTPAKPQAEMEVSAATVDKAVVLCKEYLLPHAKKALGLITGNPLLEAARRVVAVLAKWEGKVITRRDIHRLGGRLFKKADEVDPVLEMLVEYGYLKAKDELFQKSGKGHKSPEYKINPRILASE